MSTNVVSTTRWRSVRRWTALGVTLVLGAAVAAALAIEVRSSRWQAELFSRLAKQTQFRVEPGPSDAIRFPGHGPFDQRLGYAALPRFTARATADGFEVAAQARWSPRALQIADRGLNPPFREKSRAGLAVLDCRAEPVHEGHSPQRVFAGFDDVPPVLVAALLFIENRTLLDDGPATRNPAVEWPRLGRAVLDQLLHRIDGDHGTPGGSTLATQIEKFRHSPEGRTDSGAEKLRQMASASLRAYLDGEDTRQRRREIVVDYLNNVPLAARAGVGEVHGLPDGLAAWYGRDFDEVRSLLAADDDSAADASRLAQRGLALKQSLSLLVAQRRPSHYLAGGAGATQALAALTDTHLRLIADAGLIDPALRDAALEQPLQPAAAAPPAERASFVDRKAASALRTRIAALLEVPRLYDLDRLDLEVASTLDLAVQQRVGAALASLATRDGARSAGLYGFRLLDDGQDPSPLKFSFTLYERGALGNLLRVQTDSLDLPFDINEGARLDLGSTAKLRTLASYLEIVAALHSRWQSLDAAALRAERAKRGDAIGRWAIDHLSSAADRSLPAMLDAAMQRRYSASPGEAFYTGGGMHRFANFDRADDARVVTVAEAFRHSINLPFIRLMRDIVKHLIQEGSGPGLAAIDDRSHPARRELLERVADAEGREFLAGFHRRYAGVDPDVAFDRLLAEVRAAEAPLASALLAVEPDAGVERLGSVLRSRLGDRAPEGRRLEALHARHAAFNLADHGYLTRRHPLELWLVGYLRRHPGAGFAEVVDASRDARRDVYAWLFRTRNAGAQDRRLRDLVERDAFAELQRRWARLGYPFEHLTPSYATSIGASGDRPAALAELVGIVANEGLRRPAVRIESLHFGRATPYETRFERRPAAGEPVMDPAVAAVLRGAMRDVVANGTARRLAGALPGADGREALEIGAKTGTGDHRRKVFGRGGVLRDEQVVSRSASLVFTIGERHFGTLVAYVEGSQAARYRFTSALPAQLLKSLLPALDPMLRGPACAPAEPATTALRSVSN